MSRLYYLATVLARLKADAPRRCGAHEGDTVPGVLCQGHGTD